MYEEMNMDEIVEFFHEIEKETARINRKANIKAKRHLVDIYSIVSDTVRQNRNGAYIRKGNTFRGGTFYKRYDHKVEREEGKAEVRNYIPEPETETIITPSAEEKEIRRLMTEIADARQYIADIERSISRMEKRIADLQAIITGEARSWSF